VDTDTTQPFSNEIKHYISLFRRWAWLLIIFSILGGVVAYYFSLQQTKIYQASATVMIDQRQSSYNDYSNLLYNERLAQTYTQMMVQPPTLEGVIDELDLDMSVGSLQGKLTVSVVPDTQLLMIRVQDSDPQRAAEIVNTIGIVFAQKNAELQASRYAKTKSGLEAQLLSTDQQIQETIRTLDTLKNTQDENVPNILQIQLDAYQAIYQGLLMQIFELESQPVVSEVVETDTDENVATGLVIEQKLALIETEITNLTNEIEAIPRFQQGAEYDILNIRLLVYQSLYQQLLRDLVFSTDTDTAINLTPDTVLTPDIDTLSAQLEITGERIQELTASVSELGGSSDGNVERDRLESNLVLYRQTYANLVQSYEQTRLAEIQNTTRVDLVQPASTPTAPVRPDIMQNTMLGAIVGLMVGAGIAFAIELMDDTVKGAEDIMRRLRLPILGYISRMEESGLSPITAQEPRSPQAESFRALRTNIQYASVDQPINSIIITSPTPKDGKSTIAANLGVVLAQGRFRVCLIDADMRRPLQHKIFGSVPAFCRSQTVQPD